MGCDIHLYVEKLVNGKWEIQRGFVSSMYEADSEFFSTAKFRNAVTPYDNRNYQLFGALAGVREDNIKPIAEPRGLPDDASPEVAAEAKDYGIDGHTHSWLTLKEILDFDWSQIVVREGIVSRHEYQRLKKSGRPKIWCGGTSAKVITNAEMEAVIEDKGIGEDGFFDQYATAIKWTAPLKDYCGAFVYGAISQLKERSEAEDASDIRIVFWFDC